MMPYSIEQLIPQRYPFLFVDELVSVDGDSCTTRFSVSHASCLVDDSGLIEAGVIEHMAQSASSLAGYQSLQNGGVNPPVGMIGELKSFVVNRLPSQEETLETRISFGLSVGNITVATAKTYVSDEMIAEATFKISIE